MHWAGLARSLTSSEEISGITEDIQRDLYALMAELATLDPDSSKLEVFGKEKVSWLEQQIERIEEQTGMGRLEARGTLRIALRASGLDARKVTKTQMCVVLDRVMPDELRARGVERPEAQCNALAAAVKSMSETHEVAGEAPEDVFRRLGSR